MRSGANWAACRDPLFEGILLASGDRGEEELAAEREKGIQRGGEGAYKDDHLASRQQGAS